MLRDGFSRLIGPLMVLTLFMASGVSFAQSGGDGGKTATYFSQGQAVNNAQDQNASQQSAVNDFLVQALTQAMGTFLSPSQLGSQFNSIQEKILKQPQRYIATYQIFSETPAGGLYKVTGQATVAMDLLKKDVEQLGVGSAQARMSSGTDQAPPPASSSAERTPQEKHQSSRGVIVTRQELFWAVAEKWGQQWYIPRGKGDSRGLFALSVMREAQDFDWSLHLPETSSITIEPNGNVSIPQVVSEAKALGIRKAVVGTVGVRKKQDQDNSIEAILRILDVSTGTSQGEIRKTWKAGQTSDQDDAVELASLVIPQLDNLLHDQEASEGRKGAPSAGAAPGSGEAQEREGSDEKKGASEWTLSIPSERAFAYLEELQNLLRERSKSFQVKRVEMGAGEVRMRVEGVDGSSLSALQGTRLPSGVQLQVEGVSQENRSARLSFGPAGASQTEPKQ